MRIVIRDNSRAAISHLDEWKERVLEKLGMEAERKAADNIRTAGRVDTGLMINSITHTVIDDTVYIGSNNSYLPYHEYGTGKFASAGNGRPGWWVYVPGDNSHRSTERKTYTYDEARRIVAAMQAQDIDAHMTQGIKPIHALRNAISDNMDVYERIIKETE